MSYPIGVDTWEQRFHWDLSRAKDASDGYAIVSSRAHDAVTRAMMEDVAELANQAAQQFAHCVLYIRAYRRLAIKQIALRPNAGFGFQAYEFDSLGVDFKR